MVSEGDMTFDYLLTRCVTKFVEFCVEYSRHSTKQAMFNSFETTFLFRVQHTWQFDVCTFICVS